MDMGICYIPVSSVALEIIISHNNWAVILYLPTLKPICHFPSYADGLVKSSIYLYCLSFFANQKSLTLCYNIMVIKLQKGWSLNFSYLQFVISPFFERTILRVLDRRWMYTVSLPKPIGSAFLESTNHSSEILKKFASMLNMYKLFSGDYCPKQYSIIIL